MAMSEADKNENENETVTAGGSKPAAVQSAPAASDPSEGGRGSELVADSGRRKKLMETEALEAEDLLGEDYVDDDVDVNEDAAPLEELVESEPADEDIPMNWYIIKVQVNRESSICDALLRRVRIAGLDRYFGDVLVPTEDVREFTKSGKQRIVKRKLYPGYIVIRMAINDDSWFLVRETPGIGDFTGASGKPAPLSQEEIDRIVASTRPEKRPDSEEAVKTAIKFKSGDRVRVKEGYFQNYEGEVSAIDERNGRVTVMINIFGRPNPVELHHWQIENL
jgi:transcription termination/antitermination protein NusG